MQVSSAAGLSNFEILVCKNLEMLEKDIWLTLNLVLVHMRENSPFAKCQ